MSGMRRFPPLTCRVFITSRLSLDFPWVCPGHAKDASSTTIANRAKVKQTRRRVPGEGLGPLHLALTPAATNKGVELPGLIGLHPLEQQSLLWGSHVKLIVARRRACLLRAGVTFLSQCLLCPSGFWRRETMDQRKCCRSAGG